MFEHFVGARWKRGDQLGGGVMGAHRNQGLSSLIAVRERVNALWGRVNIPTMDGMSTIACRTPGNGEC